MIFSVGDIKRILDALASAGDERGPEYRRALGDVALAVGVALPARTWHVVEMEGGEQNVRRLAQSLG